MWHGDVATSISDLDVYSFRKIFSYLEDAEIYFNMRCVSRQFKSISEGYISLGNFNIENQFTNKFDECLNVKLYKTL